MRPIAAFFTTFKLDYTLSQRMLDDVPLGYHFTPEKLSRRSSES